MVNLTGRLGVLKIAVLGLVALALAACGGGGSNAAGPSTPPAPPVSNGPASTLALLAGSNGGPGALDGTGPAARFNTPSGIAVDGSGNLYVADSQNNTIRKISAAGVVTTVAGSPGVAGFQGSTGADALLDYPSGVAVDGSGNLYVADTSNNSIRKINALGQISTLLGPAFTNAAGGVEFLLGPVGVAVDAAGNVYVADSGNHVVRKVSSAGVVTTLAGTVGAAGSADGLGAVARFNRPLGIAVDGGGNIYVADALNGEVRKVTPAGNVSTLAGSPADTGPLRLQMPTGVAVDAAGNVYVADNYTNSVRKVPMGSGTADVLAGSVGSPGIQDGVGAAAGFQNPFGVAVDANGNVFVSDASSDTIRKISPAAAVSTVAGQAPLQDSVDGTGANAGFVFFASNAAAIDASGNVFVSDDAGTIRQITPSGQVTTFAGTAYTPGAGSGGQGAQAVFSVPAGVAVDSAGNLFVADSGNHVIRKLNAVALESTFAGAAGVIGSQDGVDINARFNNPAGLAFDGAGNLYVSDSEDNTIRKITPQGVVSTLAGTAGVTGNGNGLGAAAAFFAPIGLAVDASGNVYVADSGNHLIRKISASGTTTTFAGTGVAGTQDGAATTAQFNLPTGIALDGAGNVYVADSGNFTIRKITADGVVRTVIGTRGLDGFAPGALPGGLNAPVGVAIKGPTMVIVMGFAVATVTPLP